MEPPLPFDLITFRPGRRTLDDDQRRAILERLRASGMFPRTVAALEAEFVTFPSPGTQLRGEVAPPRGIEPRFED